VEIIASEDKNTNSLFSGLVLAMILFYYNVNVQYNTKARRHDLAYTTYYLWQQGIEVLRRIGKVIAPKWAEVP
jgi:hypothetical protein